MTASQTKPNFEVSSFGRDCLGNISGYQVDRYIQGEHEIAGKFFGDIYTPDSFDKARADAQVLRDKRNAALTSPAGQPAMPVDIRQVTINRCIEEQFHAAECHLRAVSWMAQRRGPTPPDADELFAATREQLIGAHYSADARMYLDRLNGHA